MTTTTTASTLEKKFKNMLDLHCLDGPIGSTQDEAKRLLAELNETNNNIGSGAATTSCSKIAIAVLASQQENGRGTQGRKWEGQQGNVYLTVAIPLDQIPVTITLLPLQMGVLIAQTLEAFLRPSSSSSPQPKDDGNEGTRPYFQPNRVIVKWPNDVLVDGGKIAGVLIENWVSPSSHDCWLLIGVGINVAFSPSLPNGVREATCLQDCFNNKLQQRNIDGTQADVDAMESAPLPDSTSQQMALTLIEELLDWIMNTPGDHTSVMERQVLEKFKSYAEFGQLYKIRETGEEVTTLDVQSDGQLRVRGADGQDRNLVADYLY